MKKAGLILAIVMFGAASYANNIALNKDVTLNGTFFTGGWNDGGMIVSPSTVTDGFFFEKDHQWDMGGVWWDANLSPNNNIVIDLAGTYLINSFIVQADDNDAYLLEYHDPLSDTWNTAWNIPQIPAWGLQTHPDPYDNTIQFNIASPITADELRISGTAISDNLFSVSEIQAFGTAKNVPEPSTIILMVMGLSSLFGARLFRRKK